MRLQDIGDPDDDLEDDLDDDFDDDDDDDENGDADDDEEEETWQVSGSIPTAKSRAQLDFGQ
jgi:hypothetical protein